MINYFKLRFVFMIRILRTCYRNIYKGFYKIHPPLHIYCLKILATCVLLGCANNYNNPLNDFSKDNEIVLVGEEIRFQSDTILFRPRKFEVYDTLAIFNDNTGEAGFSIVNLKDGRLVEKFGFAGNGESEMNINAVSMENGVANNDSVFSITQVNSPHKIFRYNWDSLLNKSEYRPKPIFYSTKITFSNTYFLNDSILFGKFLTSNMDNKTFGVLNLYTNKLTTGIEVPGNENNKTQSEKDSLYFKYLNMRMDNRVAYRPGSFHEFACFSGKGAVIQIISVDKNYRLKKKYQKVYYLPTFNLLVGPNSKKIVAGKDSKKGFRNIAVSDKNIFALYSGPLLNDSDENFNISDIVLVYDWEGNPVNRIKLDRKVNTIAIDRENFTHLYGMMDSNKLIK